MEKHSAEFTLFGNFAPEIRIKILQEAIESDSNARVFEIGESDDVEDAGTPTRPSLANVSIAKHSCPPAPALLSVCHEANAEVRKKYQAVKFRNRTVYINFNIDWILLPDYSRRDGLDRDSQWWMFREALINDGYWPMIRNIAVPAIVWAQLSWTEDLVNGTTVAQWPKELEGMPCLERVVMVFEAWAQWEGRQESFATKGSIEFGNVEDFYVSKLGGNMPLQWIDHAKGQINEIETRKLWTVPEVKYASVLRNGMEPLMDKLMREVCSRDHGQDVDSLFIQILLDMADL